jgi:hypothetical protein
MSIFSVARADVICGLLLFGCSGCLVSPYDLETFDHQSSITMGGATLTPGGTVQIQACFRPGFLARTCSTHFDTIATVQAASANGYVDHYNGDTFTWYAWQLNVNVPSAYWSKPSNATDPPPSATIRILDPAYGDAFYHYDNDPNECPLPWGMAQLTSTNPLCGHPTPANTGIIIFAPP